MRTVGITDKRRVVIEYYLSVPMIPIVIVEIIEQFRDLPLVFDEKRFEDAKLPVLSHLANPPAS